jgi:hypothetical protein
MIEEYGERMFDMIVDGTIDPEIRKRIEYYMRTHSYCPI